MGWQRGHLPAIKFGRQPSGACDRHAIPAPAAAALWALQSATATNGAQPAAPTNGTRVAVLLPGEMRFPDFDNLMASMAAFDVFISTYVEDEDRARLLRPKGLVLTDRSTVSLPGGKGRMYQWYHLDRLLKEYKAELLEYDVLFKTRSDCYFFEPLTAAHFSHVHGEFLHMNSDISFYARAATFFYVYESMFDDVRGKYLRAGHVYFDLDYENLVAAYGIDAVNKQHVHTKRHPTIRYRFTRINLAIAARQLVYPTSVYHRSTKVLIENIESHLRAGLPIDNGKYTNRNLGDNTFASEKFHLVHAINRAPIADFAAPTVGVLLRPRPAAAPGSCPRPTAHDALLQAWRDALADPPEDTSERPREKRRTPSQTRPNKRRENKRRQDVCPRATPDALLDAWRDALAQKIPEGVCKNRRPKSAARLAQETSHRKFGRADLADKRRHADRVAAKANLYARGARIRTEATGGR